MINNSILGLNSFLTCINDSRIKRLTIGPYWILVEAEYGTGLVANPQTKISANSVKEYQKKHKYWPPVGRIDMPMEIETLYAHAHRLMNTNNNVQTAKK